MEELHPRLLAITVGNTNTRFGVFEKDDPTPQRVGALPSDDIPALCDAIMDAARRLGEYDGSLAAMASVNDTAASALVRALEPRLNQELLRIGSEVKIPVRVATEAGAKTGQDRLLNALAAWDVHQQACVVVDAGTAITIDFVDGDGVFQGGAIAPGARMWLRALHEHTAALPMVELARPADGYFGRNTEQAMLQAVYFGIRGMVRSFVERYAEAFEAYPPVVATGGDAILLFEQDELIDTIVPDLTLRGIAAACGIMPKSIDHPDADEEPPLRR